MKPVLLVTRLLVRARYYDISKTDAICPRNISFFPTWKYFRIPRPRLRLLNIGDTVKRDKNSDHSDFYANLTESSPREVVSTIVIIKIYRTNVLFNRDVRLDNPFYLSSVFREQLSRIQFIREENTLNRYLFDMSTSIIDIQDYNTLAIYLIYRDM